jgi:hypothetical protein
MLRDTRRDNAYFDKWIDFTQSVITEDKGTLKSLHLPEGRAGCASYLFSDALTICIMKYGRGDSLSSIRNSVQQTLEIRELMMSTLAEVANEHPNISKMHGKLHLYNYSNGLTLLCFILATGGTQEDIRRTLNAFDYAGQDILLDKLATML